MEQDNIDDMFSQMLGELDDLTQQLNTVSVSTIGSCSSSQQKLTSTIAPSEQFDEVTEFDDEDVNLTAILNDLSQIEEDINKHDHSYAGSREDRDSISNNVEQSKTESVEFPFVINSPPTQHFKESVQKNQIPVEYTPPPDLCPSVPSSLPSVPVVESDQVSIATARSDEWDRSSSSISQEDSEEALKSEKVRIALEKLKEARVIKLVVKVFNKDNSSKTIMIDERMSTRTVLQQLIEKNHFDFSSSWSLVEEMPSLFIERIFEDHEKPCETMKHWTRDSSNQLRFIERKDKYSLFKNPHLYLLPLSEMQTQMQEPQKQILIEEFFSESGPSSCLPEIEGFLHIKNGKSWSRKYCVLRSSGLYMSKNGEPKKGRKLSDLVLLVSFDQNLLYFANGWKKKLKAPFEYGFALKNPAIQVKSKHIRCMVCEDFHSLMRWVIGIRLAKYGRQLLENYQKTNEELKLHSTVPVMNYLSDSISLQSSDSGDTGFRSSTLPRHVDVKNVFEGAWQRAGQGEKIKFERSTIPRSKGSEKLSQKKKSNWWDLQDSGQGSSESNIDENSSASVDDLNAVLGDRLNPTFHDVKNLPPPPPTEDFPPPPSLDEIRQAQVKHLPPPVSSKPIPPPISSKPTYKMHQSNVAPPSSLNNHSSGRENTLKRPPPLVRTKRTGSCSSIKRKVSEISIDDLPLPPPPEKYNGNGTVAPLSNYYMNGNSGKSFTIDDFPPPPPFVLDLKESFLAVTEGNAKERRKSVEQTPQPNKLIAYIKSQTISRLQGNRMKSKKSAMSRNTLTRHSSKRR